jgi:cobalt/nickel transport system permease protein
VHISEGVLSLPVLAGGAALGLAGVAWGLRRLPMDHLPQTAVLSAAFFVAGLIHVPIPPAQVHLLLNGMLGLILGPAAFPAIFVALSLQALLFQFGGLTTLGINTCNMALPALLSWFCLRRLLFRGRLCRLLAGALAGLSGVLGSGLLLALSLALSGEDFYQLAVLILLAHIPVMVIEGVITALLAEFLAQVRPELLAGPGRPLR